jgi:uncharacterized membrane-anchored protein YhcB (DUF1043 family)
MQKFLLSLTLYLASLTFAQAQTPADSAALASLQQQVGKLQTDLKRQRNNFSKQILSTNEKIKSLQNEIANQQQTVAVIADNLGVKIEKTASNAETQIADVSENIGKKTLFGIISGIVLLLLSVGLFLYLFFKRKADSASIVKQLEEQKSSIETKLVKEYSVQAEVLENLMKTIRELPVSAAGTGELDHSLALKVADQLTSLERSISLIDEKTKGLQRIKNSLTNLRDNLIANGYELPELLGKPFNQGMNIVVVNTLSDEKLKIGEEIITRIIKPQVNYKDKMIQAAQIEVSVG